MIWTQFPTLHPFLLQHELIVHPQFPSLVKHIEFTQNYTQISSYDLSQTHAPQKFPKLKTKSCKLFLTGQVSQINQEHMKINK